MKRKVEIEETIETSTENGSFLPEIFQEIGRYLTEKQICYFAMTQQQYYSFFRKPDFFVSQFLSCVARGEQDKAQFYLKINLAVLIENGWVTDYSRRIFCTSAFKYILGALDTRYMFNMFITSLKEHTQFPLQKKKEIAKKLLKQYEEFEKEGIDYTLDGIKYKNVQHFGFTPLMEVLKTYVTHVKQWSVPEKNKFINTDVGKAQFLVPAHLAQHYCDPDTFFDPLPSFTVETFKRCLDIRDTDGTPLHTWWEFGAERGLGQHFSYVGRGGAVERAPGVRQALDLAAITALFEKRQEDKLAIKTCLEALIEVFSQDLEAEMQVAHDPSLINI